VSSHRIDLPSKEEGSRHWPAVLKEEIVLATLEAGATVASVARDFDLDPSQIYQWRKALKVSRLPSQEVATSPEFLPVQVWAADCGEQASVQEHAGQEQAESTSGPERVAVSSSISGAIEIQVGPLHRVRVCDDFASDTLERVLDVLRRQQ
jgi:transposase